MKLMLFRTRCRARMRLGTCRRGAAAVEFAIVLPLFLLLMAGIIEFGQAFRISHSLSLASRRGVRAAVVDGATNGQVINLVRKQCSDILGAPPGDFTVQISVDGNSSGNLSTAEKGDEITISVSVPYSKVGAGFFLNTFSESVLSSTATMEHE